MKLVARCIQRRSEGLALFGLLLANTHQLLVAPNFLLHRQGWLPMGAHDFGQGVTRFMSQRAEIRCAHAHEPIFALIKNPDVFTRYGSQHLWAVRSDDELR